MSRAAAPSSAAIVRMRPMRRGPVVIGGVAAAIFLSGCSVKDSGTNKANGKQQFVDQCARCPTLARAGAAGVPRPDLDAALAPARAHRPGQGTNEGVVH